MAKKTNIGDKSKVNIKWNVKPVNYSHEYEESIISTFAEKYGIRKENIRVEPVFIRDSVQSDDSSVFDSVNGNIQDVHFQHELFKQYLEENGAKDYDFEEIVKIDNSINECIDYDLYDKKKRYTIKWVKWSNFMSYGPDNFFDFTNLDGLVLLSSDPANQGGKSTFCIDIIRFLLFGKVTSRESDWTLSKVFNKHLPEATEAFVEGCVEIDGQDYVINRTVTRPQLKKRSDKSKVTQKVHYYKITDTGYESLEDEDKMDGDTNRETNSIIKEAIGNERDFDLMICVNSDNLKGLISLKDTDRGRLISRWIGLLPLEEKDKIARERFNTSVLKNMLSTRYNADEVKKTIEELKNDSKEYGDAVKEFEKGKKKLEKKIENDRKKRDALVASKIKIDGTLTKVDVVTLEQSISDITDLGKKARINKKEAENKLKELADAEYSEDMYRDAEKRYSDLLAEVTGLRVSAKSVKNEIEMLKKSEFCPTCGARLKDVDNSKQISDKEDKYNEIINAGIVKSNELKQAEENKKKLSEDRNKYNERTKTEIYIDKLNAELENLTVKYKEKKRILSDITANKDAIEKNGRIDADINVIDEMIRGCEKDLRNIIEQIAANNSAIKTNERIINENEKILSVLSKEESVIRNWKLYLEMIGKHGISKMVLRKVLPFINGELRRLLNDVCDFTVEVSIDDRNDVEFSLIHNGVVSSLASGSGFEQTVASLALRSVLSKISTFSKPSFVVFDEILGGVADENYDQVRELYNKISKDYKFILQISHLKNLYEWHNHVIRITKRNDISVIENA